MTTIIVVCVFVVVVVVVVVFAAVRNGSSPATEHVVISAMIDSCGVRAHSLADWRLKLAPETSRPNCLASLMSGSIRPATCGRRALRFCFMISQELAMLLSGYSANALAGQARMASTRAGDRNRATSLMMFPLARRTFCGRSSSDAPGIEPGTYRALSENHTTQPSSQM